MGFFETLFQECKDIFFNIVDHIDTVLFAIIKIVLIVVIARLLIVLLSKLIKKSLRRKAQKKSGSLAAKKCDTLITLMQSIVRYIIYFFMIVCLLDVIGLSNTIWSVLATAGIGGIAISLGAQSFIKDVLSGFFMLFDDEFAVGDYVEIPDLHITGTVSAISLRSTHIKLVHGETATIPNGTIGTVINFTRDSYTLFLDYEISPEEDDLRAANLIIDEMEKWALSNQLKDADPDYLGVANIHPFKTCLKFCLKVPPMMQWQAERDLNKRVQKRFLRETIKRPEYQKGLYVDQAQ